MPPELKPVESSNIAKIGHEGDKLHVQFKGNPDIYVYTGVDADLHSRLVGAPSIGGFFHQNVKGKFPHEIV